MKKIRSVLLSVAVGLAGFIATAATLRQIDPLRGVPDVKAQILRVSQCPDTTMVFFGSSLTRRGVNPAELDRQLSKFGVGSRSLNCGIDGMTMPEVLFMVEQVLRRPPPTLRWIVLEASSIRLSRNPGDATARDVYWHTTPLTLTVFQKLCLSRQVQAGERPSLRIDLAADHAELWFRRFTNLGRISEFTRPVPSSSLPPLADSIRKQTFYSDERGFLAIDLEMPREEQPRFADDLERIHTLWKEAREDTVSAQVLLRLTQRLERLGLQLILLHPPDTRRRPAPYPTLAKHGVPALNFMQPDRYPELYRPAHRYDSRHLNGKGAQLFSQRLAEELASIVGSTATN